VNLIEGSHQQLPFRLVVVVVVVAVVDKYLVFLKSMFFIIGVVVFALEALAVLVVTVVLTAVTPTKSFLAIIIFIEDTSIVIVEAVRKSIYVPDCVVIAVVVLCSFDRDDCQSCPIKTFDKLLHRS
jgi:hypothetical protein